MTVDIASLRKTDSKADLGRGFFRRSSTQAYIEQLATLDAVTLYAGAGVSADIGTPLWQELMSSVLLTWIGEEPQLKGLSEIERNMTSIRVAEALAKHYSPAHLASILRCIAYRRAPSSDPEKNAEFRREIDKISRSGRAPGGFLARSIGILAFSYKHQQRNIQIVTTNYDFTIEEERDRIGRYFADLANYKFLLAAGDTRSPTSDEVRVVHVNGVLDHSRFPGSDVGMVIGEVDFFARYGEGLTPLGAQEWRVRVLEEALSTTASVFVGSSVTDPDVLVGLATTKHYDQPRYAVLLRPNLGLDDSIDRALAYKLVGDRFEHLGVIPIFVDFKHQIPQLLREVALKISLGSVYKDYSTRLEAWWKHWHVVIGGTSGNRNQELQQIWYETLQSARDKVQLKLDSVAGLEDERVMVEVWLRNIKTRRLFHWCSSEGMWLNNESAHSASIEEGDQYHVQKTFRDGRTQHNELEASRGHWRYYLGMPLVLHEDPWYHLPVGVLSVLSTKSNGALRYVASHVYELEELEDGLKEPVNGILDPITR